jgi:hypothetical protein
MDSNTGKRPDLPLKKRFVRHARPKNENFCTVGRGLAAGEKTRHSGRRMGSRPEKKLIRRGKTMKTLVKTGVVALLLGTSAMTSAGVFVNAATQATKQSWKARASSVAKISPR